MKSSSLYTPIEYIKNYGNKPFAQFDENSWELFFKLVRIMLLEIEQIITYQYSGWNNSLNQYLYGTYLVDTDSTYRVKSALIKSETELSNKSTAEILRNVDEIAKNLSNQSMLPGYMSLMYLMHSHYKQRLVIKYKIGPEFVMGINGPTGSHKSSSVIALFNTHDSSVSSFEDSEASIRRQFQSNKSGVTIVDDYKVSSVSNDAKYEKIQGF